MARGRPVTTALDTALRIGRQRGQVMRFAASPENFAHFLIRRPGAIVFVLIRYSQRIHGTAGEIAIRNDEAISLLRSVPASAGIVRELWLYSRYGCWRYFQVGDEGIEEIGRDNLSSQKPASPVPAAPVTVQVPQKEPAPSEGR